MVLFSAVATSLLSFCETITEEDNPFNIDGRAKRGQATKATSMAAIIKDLKDDPNGTYDVFSGPQLEGHLTRCLNDLPAAYHIASSTEKTEFDFFTFLKVVHCDARGRSKATVEAGSAVETDGRFLGDEPGN